MIKKLLSLILLLAGLSCTAQSGHHLFRALPTKSSALIKKYTPLELDTNEFNLIKKEKPGHLDLDTLSLQRIENNTKVIFSDGVQRILPEVVSYRGTVKNSNGSIAAVSFVDKEVMGVVSTKDHGNYVIGKENNRHILYNERDLTVLLQLKCLTSGDTFFKEKMEPSINLTTNKCVNWYWETDYDLFVNKGSAANVYSYVQGIFNQVAALYANDGITIKLKTLYIWTTQDPYTGPSSGAYQLQFATHHQNGFDGDLAHLLGLGGSGGVANVGTLCTIPYYETAYSQIGTTYNTIPIYSYTVYCIAHEEGHLLGSRHTHDCVWNGNNTVIDACGQVAGYPSANCGTQPTGPIPYNVGGTIMSYCHLVYGVGINLSLGFSQQVRDVIVNNLNSSCLPDCQAGCIPTTETQVLPCPTGQTGSITQTRNLLADCTHTEWVTISNTCVSSTTKIDSIKTSAINKAQLTCYWQPVSGATTYKFYWQRVGNTGKNVLGSATTSPKVFSLSSNISYNIWFEAKNAAGMVLGTSPKVLITTGTGVTYW